VGRKRLIYYGIIFSALGAWLAWRGMHPDAITIRLHRTHLIEVNGAPTALDRVADVLRGLDAAAPRRTVTIRADDDAPAAELIELVARVNQAGVEHIEYEAQR
jgi:biopolymer transport protein ExbD